jgi:hypothetical protein
MVPGRDTVAPDVDAKIAALVAAAPPVSDEVRARLAVLVGITMRLMDTHAA